MHKNILFVLVLSLGIGFFFISRFFLQQTQFIEPKLSSPLIFPLFSSKPTPQPTQNSTIRILFGGDLMFDRNIRTSMQKNGVEFPLSSLRNLFFSYDFVVANLEGPITSNQTVSVGSVPGSTKNFIFTFDPQVANMLQQFNFGAVSIANNHIQNFGVRGVEETKQKLQEVGLPYFGNTGNETFSADRVYFKNLQGKTIAFVGVNQFVSDGYEAGFNTGVEDITYANTIAELVIVMPHWGNEYQPTSSAVIQEQAHRFIDAGADLVIGAHPHVIQQSEVYKEKTIYYSLGNFVFDQYFSAEVQQGLLVGVEISQDNAMTFTEIPIRLQPGGQTILLSNEKLEP